MTAASSAKQVARVLPLQRSRALYGIAATKQKSATDRIRPRLRSRNIKLKFCAEGATITVDPLYHKTKLHTMANPHKKTQTDLHGFWVSVSALITKPLCEPGSQSFGKTRLTAAVVRGYRPNANRSNVQANPLYSKQRAKISKKNPVCRRSISLKIAARALHPSNHIFCALSCADHG